MSPPVDLDAVHRWGVAAGLPDAPIRDVRRIGGGTQNIVLRLCWGDRDLVLRHPPEHPRTGSNRALRREMRVLAALAGTDQPADARPGIVHGDYHLNNVLLAHDGPRVAAVVDWEMCTIGDPLLDLGWLLVTWPGGTPEPITGGPLAALGDLPGPAELVERYASHSDRDLSTIDWYTALAGLKLAVVIEGTHARALAGRGGPGDRTTPPHSRRRPAGAGSGDRRAVMRHARARVRR